MSHQPVERGLKSSCFFNVKFVSQSAIVYALFQIRSGKGIVVDLLYNVEKYARPFRMAA